ncbi:MAG: polymerase family protein [Chitinophagaceae bacterium]|nr:polymerase family protein [Chitinophagaceae bacterium]
MSKRFVMLWFRYLRTDWFTRRQSRLRDIPFVLSSPDHGRMMVTAANTIAQSHHINVGMVVADARAIIPSLEILDDRPELSDKLLKGLAEWCIRYTPFVAIDPADGLILDATGCAHLWGSEKLYLEDIVSRLKSLGYNVRAAMADTMGTAWAIAHYGKQNFIVECNQQSTALLSLPPECLRLEYESVGRLHTLGLSKVGNIIGMQRSALRRRFGGHILQRLDQALGNKDEIIQPVQPIEPYQERLPSLEPIVTATGIGIALEKLLEIVCTRLQQEQKGLRVAIFKCYRVDGRMEKIEIGTNRPSYNRHHLFKLFELKIETIEPDLGIDLFILEAQKVEPVSPIQEKLWQTTDGLENLHLSELLDRFSGKYGAKSIHRFLPAEHYWPERSFKQALSIDEKLSSEWKDDRPRPVQLLPIPERIEVMAPVPDYPPMNFRYKGKLHKVTKADGPERIEQEWWLQKGQHRDYYYVEDEEGKRYWLFRSGHYSDKFYQWFIHGFFA